MPKITPTNPIPADDRPKRISEFTGLNPFETEGIKSVKIEHITDTELIIQEYAWCEITTPDGKVPGAAIKVEDAITGEVVSTVSFSTVLNDQLRKVPEGGFPVLAKIEWLGQGSRRYLHMS